MASFISHRGHHTALFLLILTLLNEGVSLDIRNKPAITSSSPPQVQYAPSNSVDGNFGTISHSGYMEAENRRNPWWRVDLEAIYCLRRITIINRQELPQLANRLAGGIVRAGLNSDHSRNPMVGSPITLDQVSSFNNVIDFILDSIVTARYVSVELPGDDRFLSPAEVIVEEAIDEEATASTGFNLAGSAAVQSSTLGSQWAASNAVNRAFQYDEPHCSQTSAENNPWWRLDLMSNQCVRKITIKTRDALNINDRYRFRGAVVRAGNSTTVTNNRMCGSPVTRYQAVANNWMEFACNSPDGVIARYVSVDIPGTNKQLALCEVLVTSCDQPEVDYTVVTNPALIGQTGDDDAVIAVYRGPTEISADDVAFGRQLLTGGSNSGLPSGSSETLDQMCESRQLQMPAAGGIDRTGVFYFQAITYEKTIRIQTVILPREAVNAIRPSQRTQVASIGDSVTLVMQDANSSPSTNYIWRHNGGNIITTGNNPLSLTIDSVTSSDEGIYTCFVSNNENQQHIGITRLIVKECTENMWGPPSCVRTCRRCYNGGICDDKTGKCICAPGFSGKHCGRVHGRNIFGQNGSQRCSADSDDPHSTACQGRLFCLPDPYGCSCAAGYMGLDCMQECSEGTYGADCKQTCHCAAGGTCSKDTGKCSDGTCESPYFGINCQCSRHEASPDEESITHESVTFTWKRPTCSLHSGTVTRYMYQLTNVDSGTVFELSNTVQHSVSIQGLVPYTEYNFQVRVTTSSGDGPYEGVIVRTAETAPTKPLHFAILSVDDTSITVVWSAPEPPNGNITNYDIAYWKTADMGSPTIRDIGVMTPLMYHLMGLESFVTYHIQVRAKTSAGVGPWSTLETTFTQIGVPGLVSDLRVTDRTDDSISLEWEEPRSPNGRITGYNVKYRAVDKPYDDTFEILNEYRTSDVTTAMFQKTDLESGTKYEFRVSARNQENTGKYTALEVYTKPLKDQDIPQPVEAKLSETTDTTVTIGLTGVDSKYIVSYMIKVERESQTKREVFVAKHHRDSPNDYIAAEISKTDVAMKFVVGDSLMHGGYYNAPLQTGNTYRISIGAVTKVNDTEANVRYSDPLTITARRALETGYIIAAVIGAVLFLVIILIIGYVIWRKRISQPRPTVTHGAGTEELVLSDNPKTASREQHPPHADVTLAPDNGVYEDVGLPPWANNLEIKRGNLTIEDKILGSGNFGVVRAGGLNIQGQVTEVAIKSLKVGASSADSESFMAEFQMMAKIQRHPNVVGVLGACLDEGILYVALEYLPNGNLRDYLRSTRPAQTDVECPSSDVVSSSSLLTFGADVARGMDHLSNTGIIHRDLAARNILLAEDFTAKVSDFGLSRGEDIYVQKSMTRIPARWLAIESLTRKIYQSKSDVWSFGILLWEIATFGATPYQGIPSASLVQRLEDGYRMPQPDNCGDELYELMQKCWQVTPSARPSFRELTIALEQMKDHADENIYMSPDVYANFIIQPELDDK